MIFCLWLLVVRIKVMAPIFALSIVFISLMFVALTSWYLRVLIDAFILLIYYLIIEQLQYHIWGTVLVVCLSNLQVILFTEQSYQPV